MAERGRVSYNSPAYVGTYRSISTIISTSRNPNHNLNPPVNWREGAQRIMSRDFGDMVRYSRYEREFRRFLQQTAPLEITAPLQQIPPRVPCTPDTLCYDCWVRRTFVCEE